ncbi:hypothetical protein GFS31_23210 [Leptolyngbya sp. BL0902]|uniref:hypothetical protein n=1 Tax=Leptolyngbya sp. BL0902 TaxID=1115757 RepID=UPI0018E81D42|nr:hypothetical protein [Leptolyngbya sp. BL0902]QQE65633.1 hypothetical protein GFS31_23210 [Leptolyngbya sp. BL0902]
MAHSHPAPPPTDLTQETLKALAALAQGGLQAVDDAVAQAGNGVMMPLQPWLEPFTDSVGQVIAPVATHPLVEGMTSLPGLSWLLAALGQVNVNQVRQSIDYLRHADPQASPRTLAQQVMADTALKAAGVSLVSNVAPPLTLLLSLMDVGAVAALQAQMIYRIAALYGYSPEDRTRRGEVLTIWMISASASGLVKSGLGLLNPVPLVGAAVDVATDTALIYTVGYWACRYYETKLASPTEISL